jgi:uncharacterized membrane protein
MGWEFIFILVCLLIIAGPILSILNRSKISDLQREVNSLRNQVSFQESEIDLLRQQLSDRASPGPYDAHDPDNGPEESTEPALAVEPDETPAESEDPEQATTATQAQDPIQLWQQPTSTITSKRKKTLDIEQFIKGNGLLWLGGIVLSIGGVFLAKYIIETGLLSPGLRVILGALFGIALVVATEYLNTYKERFSIYSPYVCAALASGGVITCYAMTMLSFDYYDFISARMAFILLAIIALATTSLALRFGPILAYIGIIGAYAVPALVSTGSNDVLSLLLYTSFVSLSAVWVSNTVKHKLLWWLSIVGHFSWMAVSLTLVDSSHFLVFLAFVILSVYFYVLSDVIGWNLKGTLNTPLPAASLIMPRREQLGILLPLIGLAIYLAITDSPQQIIITSLIVAISMGFLPHRHSAFDSWPFMALAFILFSFTLLPAPETYEHNLFPLSGKYLFAQLASLLGIGYSAFMYHTHKRLPYLLLLVVSPISLYGLSYVLAPQQAELYLYPIWAIALSLIAIGSTVSASRQDDSLLRISLVTLTNTCITLCLTMLLDAATLTLAITAQVTTMSYLGWKYRVTLPEWLFKLALSVVLARLTFAPWLDEYAGEQILGIHWSAVIYPLVMALLWLARYYNPSESLKTWLEGAFIHVLALLVTTETSYQLVGHYPDIANLSFKEATLLAFNWLILAGVYLWRAKDANRSKRLYRLVASILMVGVILLHMDISVLSNPFVARVVTGEGLFMNWLLILWALPALILLVMNRLGLVEEGYQSLSMLISAALAFMYINGIIRGAFHGGELLVTRDLPQTELYTYSIVWLIIATMTIFVGSYLKHMKISNLGFGILAVVVLKAFVVDMSNLEGLYRALSFIGLGVCLVGIGWLFQKLSYEVKQSQESSSSG